MTNRGELLESIEATNLKQFEKEVKEEPTQEAETKKGKKKKNIKKDERYDFNIGDTVKVWVKIVEGQGKKMRERLQGFEGTVISIKGKGIGRNFTVRKISFGVGVERVFPFKSPLIGRVEITREGKIRRAKLYYLRDRIGKAAQVKRKEFIRTAKKK
jgi:large subunit ribosomal protein L19